MERILIGLIAACVALSCAHSRPAWVVKLNRGMNTAALADYETADRLLEESGREAEQLEEPARSSALVQILEARARLSEERDEQVERERLLQEALAVRDAAQLSPLPSLFPLCDALIRLDRFGEAQEAHERILAIVKPKAEPHDWMLHQAYAVMAEAYREKGLLEASIPFYEQASVARMYAEGSGRSDIVPALDGYARALEGLGRDEDALAVREHVEWIVNGRTYTDSVVVHVRGAARFDTPVRWRLSQMPLGVFIKDPPDTWQGDSEELREITRAAVLEWSDAASPGVPSFEFTHTRIGANILIAWEEDRGEGWIGHANFGPFRLQYTPLKRVYIKVVAAYAGGGQPPNARIRQVLLHELGHALGLRGHSPYSRDLMYPRLLDDNDSIAERDRDTLREVYEMEIRAGLY